jgi:uncharacterized protein (TIRG00374 family)
MRGRWPRLIAQTIIGAVLVALVIWQTDVGRAFTVARHGQYLYLLPVLPLYLLSSFSNAVRWRLALHGVKERPPVRDLFGIYLVAMMMNRLLPMRVGDILRIQLPARRYRLSGEALAAIVFVAESLLDGCAFVILFLWSLAFLGVPPVHLTIAWTLSVIAVGGLVIAAVAARLELAEGWQHRGPFRHLPEIVQERAATTVPRFLEGLGLLRDLPVAGRALALSLGNWLIQAAVFWLFGRTFGLHLSPADAIVVTITAAIVVSLPLLPSGLGTYEVAMTGVLVLMGFPNAGAVTYALGSHLLGIGFAVLAGVFAVPAVGLGLRDLPFMGSPAGRDTLAA